MKLPNLPPIYLRPPDVRRAVIMCQAEGQFRSHDYVGKDAVWDQAQRLRDVFLQFQCERCGNVRRWGNETIGLQHSRTDADAEAAVAAELAEAEGDG